MSDDNNNNPLIRIVNLLVDGSISRMVQDRFIIGSVEQYGVACALDWLRKQVNQIIAPHLIDASRMYQIPGGLIIHIPGVQADGAEPFDEIIPLMFTSVPKDKLDAGHLEIGEWDKAKDAYPWEGTVNFMLGPDGKVWAQVGDIEDI
ncbi:MAG: hypothetical protein KJ638_12015, partial [Chloroflexi bacterium]|nr:hypothetical protein [Chloroflexota bacterium]